jgi:hypothetical protein
MQNIELNYNFNLSGETDKIIMRKIIQLREEIDKEFNQKLGRSPNKEERAEIFNDRIKTV